MKSLNKVQLIGHLGKDPETRYTPSGTAVTEFSVATGEKWRDKQTGEDKERTEWHTVVCWAKLAEIAGEFLKKGAPVFIEGSIRTDQYERDGHTVYRVKIHASDMIMLGRQEGTTRRPSSEPAERAPRDERSRQPVGGERPFAAEGADFDDDIPF